MFENTTSSAFCLRLCVRSHRYQEMTMLAAPVAFLSRALTESLLRLDDIARRWFGRVGRILREPGNLLGKRCHLFRESGYLLAEFDIFLAEFSVFFFKLRNPSQIKLFLGRFHSPAARSAKSAFGATRLGEDGVESSTGHSFTQPLQILSDEDDFELEGI